MEGALVVMLLITIPIIALITTAWRSVKQRECLHKERLLAIEKGATASLTFLDDGREVLPSRRQRSGVVIHGIVWTGVGLGFLTALATVSQFVTDDDFRKFAAVMQLWAFPAVFVGLGLLVYAFVTREKKEAAGPRA